MMFINENCVKCLYNRQAAITEDKDYLAEIRTILENRGETDTAPYMVYLFNQVYEKRFGKKYSYEKEKKECNDLLLSMQEEIREQIRRSEEPLEKALSFARVGNYMDYGALKNVDTETFLNLLSGAAWTEADHKVFQTFLKECEDAASFLLIADNCGEIVLDKIFIEFLKDRFPELRVTVMVRGGRVLNDVTKEDAVYAGIDKVAHIITNGRPVSGTVYHLLSEEAQDILENADVILSKGQGNYESLSRQERHIFYAFLCKCELFIHKFQVPKFTGMFIEER